MTRAGISSSAVGETIAAGTFPLTAVGASGAAAPRAGDLGLSEEFSRFVGYVRDQVGERLGVWLEARVAAARKRGGNVEYIAEALRQLVLRGGKRMRAVLLVAAYEACGGIGGVEAIAPAALALELLQAYLLAHDDWMDGDEVRRGGPSVPAMMRSRFGQELQGAASILAGDLASSWSFAAVLELSAPAERVVLAARELARVGEEVVHGQVRDVWASATHLTEPGEVETTYALKTASYSVRGPIVMGACLAGADEAQVAALVAFAEPLGVAFQLRDDVIGMFGDVRTTGKPSGSDLRKGKRTLLVVEAMHDPAAARSLEWVLGRPDVTDVHVAAALAAIEACGARTRVEQRIVALVQQSRDALARARLTSAGRDLLAQATVALTEREH
jgi:geranylgeranyl diphosphate synthase, type I